METGLPDRGSRGADRAGPDGEAAAGVTFLLDLGQALNEVAIPSDVLERRLRAAARGLGLEAEVYALQSMLVVETHPRDGAGQLVKLRPITVDAPWNLRRMRALVDLSDEVAAGQLSLTGARARLERVLHERSPYGPTLVLLGYAVYGGVVAMRVGGRLIEALVGALVGLIAGVMQVQPGISRAISLQKSFVAGFVGLLAAWLLAMVLPSFDVGRAIFGGMTLLVPAMVLTIGLYELTGEAAGSGVIRIAYASLRFLMLAAGMAAAIQLWSVLASPPAAATVSPLPWPVVLIAVALGGAALTFCLHGRRRDLAWIVLGAVVGYGAQLVTKAIFGGDGSPLLASLALGIVANLQGRLPGHAPATVLVPGLLQLAPGFLGSEAMFKLVGHGQESSAASYFDVVLTAFQLVTGLLLAALLVPRHKPAPQRQELTPRLGVPLGATPGR